MMDNKSAIERDDIQGLLIRGYSNLKEACFIMLQFGDVSETKKYLQSLQTKLTNAEKSSRDVAINVAFNNEGIRKLDLPKELWDSFSRQFKEGMTEPNRSFILGDYEQNDPQYWKWGTSAHEPIHCMLMIYARDKNILSSAFATEKSLYQSHGIKEVITLETSRPPNDKEHFGFHDGISQPVIDGLSDKNPGYSENVLPAGEFILGYNNIYGQLPDSPCVLSVGDPLNLLPAKENSAGVKDFGKNGSYLVVRQMSQDVHGFWNFLKTHSKEAGASVEDKAICLGAKMVGRWPSGAPLVLSPDKDDPSLSNANQFRYWDEDHHGLKCPVGAHVRRTNPRNELLTEQNSKDSLQMIQKHRLLRRGRAYGEPLANSMEAKDLMDAADDGQERGLHFMCFAGDLVRQFEFVQNAWVKFHKFGGLYDDADPIVGTKMKKEGVTTDTFTVPAEPIRRKYKDVPQFTTVKGGAYFFFPGIRAFKYLSEM